MSEIRFKHNVHPVHTVLQVTVVLGSLSVLLGWEGYLYSVCGGQLADVVTLRSYYIAVVLSGYLNLYLNLVKVLVFDEYIQRN